MADYRVLPLEVFGRMLHGCLLARLAHLARDLQKAAQSYDPHTLRSSPRAAQ